MGTSGLYYPSERAAGRWKQRAHIKKVPARVTLDENLPSLSTTLIELKFEKPMKSANEKDALR